MGFNKGTGYHQDIHKYNTNTCKSQLIQIRAE